MIVLDIAEIYRTAANTEATLVSLKSVFQMWCQSGEHCNSLVDVVTILLTC